MEHFRLVNDKGYDTPAEKQELGRLLARGEFDLDRDKTTSQICLCSHGVDECWHCGRGSKP